MSALKDRLRADLTSAIKARDEVRSSTLRMVLTAITNAEVAGKAMRVTGTHILVAAGRRPNVNGLGLDEAGIAYSAKGIVVDRRLRTAELDVGPARCEKGRRYRARCPGTFASRRANRPG